LLLHEVRGPTSLKKGLQLISTDLHNIHLKSSAWFRDRANLTPKNEQVDQINIFLLTKFSSIERTYKSINTVIDREDTVKYPIEVLNSLTVPGIPQHELKLKVGAPIILLRNLKPPQLCNGTRLLVTSLNTYTVGATIITGCAKGEHVLIPRIPLTPSEYPIAFKRLQFPLKLCFAMSINKAQGQSLQFAGIDLRNDCFSHGQLYVACSRVGSPNNLIILQPDGETINIVHKEVLSM